MNPFANDTAVAFLLLVVLLLAFVALFWIERRYPRPPGCLHPASWLRFDGAWDPALGLPIERAGSATCRLCGTDVSVALREDVAEHFGYVMHDGGPRGPEEASVMARSIRGDSAEISPVSHGIVR